MQSLLLLPAILWCKFRDCMMRDVTSTMRFSRKVSIDLFEMCNRQRQLRNAVGEDSVTFLLASQTHRLLRIKRLNLLVHILIKNRAGQQTPEGVY